MIESEPPDSAGEPRASGGGEELGIPGSRPERHDLGHGTEADPLPRRLTAWSTGAVLVGSTIGSGIFRVPSVAASEGGSLEAVALLWTVGAGLTLFGALTVAELAALFPRAGGIYVYLKEAFGPLPAFLFGWTRLLVIQPALLGGIALILSAYVGSFVPLTDLQLRGIAILAILTVGAANYRSLGWGAAIQNLSTLAKVGALVALAFLIFLLGDPSQGAFGEGGVTGAGGEGSGLGLPPGAPSLGTPSWTGFGVALIAVLWAYDGWADATYVAGEVKDPERALPRALVGGFAAVVGVYLLLNGAYLYVLPLQEMAASDLVAARAATVVLGGAGGSVVAGLVILSTLGALNGTMMSGPRVFFALGRDGLFFRPVGAVHPKRKTPHVAILLATGLGIAYVSVRSFEELAEAFILGLWPFFMLAVGAVFRLRRHRPGLPRPYRTWGYPVVPLLFLGVSGLILLNSLASQPLPTLFSFGIIASGVPVYWVWTRSSS